MLFINLVVSGLQRDERADQKNRGLSTETRRCQRSAALHNQTALGNFIPSQIPHLDQEIP